ncbi:MAG: EAL domain-containing protein [Lysobacteraceae bacterium]
MKPPSSPMTDEGIASPPISAREAQLARAQAVARIGSWHLDIATGELQWSEETCRIFGVTPGSRMTYDDFLGAIHPEDREKVDAAWQQAMQGQPYDLEHRIVVAGKVKWLRELAELEFTVEGTLRAGVGTVQDITARKQAEIALAQERQFLKSLLNTIPDLVWLKDPEGRYLACNPRFAALYGHPEQDIIGRTDPDFVDAELADFFRTKDLAAIEAGQPTTNEEWLTFADGHRELCETTKTPMFDADGHLIGVLGIAHDITERKAVEERLGLAASVFTHAREAIVITDPDGSITSVNQAFCDITGYQAEEVIGKNPRLLSSGQQTASFYAAMWRDLTTQGHWHGELWNRRKDGHLYAELLTISAVRDTSGETVRYVALFTDISELKRHQRQLEHVAHFDGLTGLANRVLFSDRLRQAMQWAQRNHTVLALAYIDLDGFKDINDRLGHDTGDRLLMQLANRLQRAVREQDTLARLGGDEFVVLMPDIGSIRSLTPALQHLLEQISDEFELEGEYLSVSGSIGVTLYPQAEEVDADQLLRQADQAMYQAKLAGKNRYQLFDSEQDSAARHRHEHIRQIRDALHRGEFQLFYQPKVNMRSGAIVGVEALIRWIDPVLGIRPPATFLPLIEDHPLALEIGDWVVETALRQISNWKAADLDLPVSINIGALQLQQRQFVARLLERLALQPGVSTDDLQLEVLETNALDDIAKASEVIQQCQSEGVKVALDDFGTGYSSLAYLKKLPAHYLKIDQSFVRGMLDDPEDLAILDATLSLASAFRRTAIAEGVESIEHGEMLLRLGCELAQGFGIAKPMPPEQLIEWVHHWHPPVSWSVTQPMFRDDTPVLYAIVEHRAWFNQFESYLRNEGNPPEMNAEQCPFGNWLTYKAHFRHRGSPLLPQLEELHHSLHEFAATLKSHAEQGNRDRALLGLENLRQMKDSLVGHLNQLILEHDL